jgi:plastocyanin
MLAGALALGCGEPEAPKITRTKPQGGAGKGESAASAEPSAPKAADKGAAGWGTITGQVVWSKTEPPPVAFVEITKEPEHCLHPRPDKKPPQKEDLVVNAASKGIKNIFAYITMKKPYAIHPDLPKDAKEAAQKDGEQFQKVNGLKWEELQQAVSTGKKKVEEIKLDGIANIDQVYCIYVPHAIAVQEGQKVLVLNKETTTHNVKVTSVSGKNDANPNMPAKTVQIFDWRADTRPMAISCAIHGWMNMGAMCFDHPYFDVTDDDGKFEIKNAPTGEINLVLRNWNGLYVQNNYKVTVPAGGSVHLDVHWDGEKGVSIQAK